MDECPEGLVAHVVTLAVGDLKDRVEGVAAWRRSLLQGHMPADSVWPRGSLGSGIRRALGEMGIARFCKDQPELVDQLLRDVLSATRRENDLERSEVARRLAELEELERQDLANREAATARKERRPEREVRMADQTLAELRRRAEQEIASLQRPPERGLVAAWGEKARIWNDIADVFGDLGQLMGRGFDLARGVLRHVGWMDVLRLRAFLEQLPQLKETIRALGRLQASTRDESVAERIMTPIRRVEEELQEVRTPHVPAETRGVVRSGDIARMLPVEATMLGHPKLRMLWHARRAERALLTYRVEGVESERVQVETESMEQTEGVRPRPERGPIIAVIDTSGSMHGLPEQVAKAITLEAVRVAHSEKRRCYLYSYSGPGDVIEHELDVSEAGIARLLTFLSHSFGGGTDIGAMSTVVARLKQPTWKKADIILVSDGQWAAPPDIVAQVEAAKHDGTRFHGVQIGSRGTTGMQTLCSPVHVFSDWASAGGWTT